MLPQFYQKVLRIHLTQSQYLLLQLLILLLQSHRQVKLLTLAKVLPQPIQYASRIRCLQRFLQLPQLSLPLLWHPIIKYWLKQEFQRQPTANNRATRRQRLKSAKYPYAIVVIDRTQWKQKNLFVASLVWDNHALPLHWRLLTKLGSSSLLEQKSLLIPVLKLLQPMPILVIGDREFHSAKLAKWLQDNGVDFILRQKKNSYIQVLDGEYKSLKQEGFERGEKLFYHQIRCNKTENIGAFNLAVYWQRGYRGKQPKDAWYLLTSLPDMETTLKIYRLRWGIEMMFKDCKTGGYNLEAAQVNEQRFLALLLLVVIAYSLATLEGSLIQYKGFTAYLGRCHQEQRRCYPRHSNFALGLARYGWQSNMAQWSRLVHELIALKPHKRRYFQQGFDVLSFMQSTFPPFVIP